MNSKLSATEAASRWSIWRDWVTANTLGEAIGLAIPAGVAALVVQTWDSDSQWSAPPGSLMLIIAGILEGTVVGLAQGIVLRRLFWRLRLRAWVICTAFGAGVAWSMGVVPGILLGSVDRTFPEIGDLHPLIHYTAAVGMGGVLGTVLGLSQWWILRRLVRKALWWIPANALAWMVAMPIVFVAAGSGELNSSGWGTVALAGAVLAIAGAVVGAVHGAALVWLAQQIIPPESSMPEPALNGTRVPVTEHFHRLPLRAHSLLVGIPLHSLDRLELPGGEPGLTLQTMSDIIGFDGARKMEVGRTTEMLFGLRSAIGRVLDWDTPKPEYGAESYLHRLTADDRSRSTTPPGTAAGISRILYEYENELLGEIINRTVHCFWLMALEKSEAEYVVWFAVYVRKRNWFTPIYMAAISPLLHTVIYPAMLRGAKERWQQRINEHRGRVHSV